MRVLTAMSGGVDSSVVALMLQQQGHDVVGVFMRNGVAGKSAEEKSCCSASDARDASVVADRLGIPFYAVDYAQEFAKLMDHFAAEYRAGRTPNPCVLCNQHLKFGHLFDLADDVGADAVATGHYARVEDGVLHTAVDHNKDQTYYLFGIDRAALQRTMFPLGGMTKDEVLCECSHSFRSVHFNGRPRDQRSNSTRHVFFSAFIFGLDGRVHCLLHGRLDAWVHCFLHGRLDAWVHGSAAIEPRFRLASRHPFPQISVKICRNKFSQNFNVFLHISVN